MRWTLHTDGERMRKLYTEAERQWPAMRLSDAFSELYQELFEKLIRARKEGVATERLANDMLLTLRERDVILREELEVEGSFKVMLRSNRRQSAGHV